jgi:hypothetical protein
MKKFFKKAETEEIELANFSFENESIDSEVLIEKIEGVLNEIDHDESDDRDNAENKTEHKTKNNAEHETEHKTDKKIQTIDSIFNRFFIDSYDLIAFKIYQAFNLLIATIFLYVFLFVRSSWILALFMLGILAVHLPIGMHHYNDGSESRSINDTYFIQTGIYYFILSIYSVMMNMYYGDSLRELISLFVYSNIPTLLSVVCFLISAESIRYNRLRKEKHDSLQSDGDISQIDRVICEPEPESESDHINSETSKNSDITASEDMESESDDTEETEATEVTEATEATNSNS